MTELSRADKLIMALSGASIDIDFGPTCDFEEICMCLINGETWQGVPNTRMEELLLQLDVGGGGSDVEINDGNYLFYQSARYNEIDKLLKICNVSSAKYMFANTSLLTTLDVSSLKTSNITDMTYMFANNQNLTEIKGLENFNTSQVLNMASMFTGCQKLTKIDVSKFDTSKVNDMSSMFANTSITSIDISHFDISSTTTNMFQNCKSLNEIIGLNKCKMNRVTAFSNTFNTCSSLTALDLSAKDFSPISTIANMCNACTSLKTLKIGNGDTTYRSNLNTSYAFRNCSALESLVIKGMNVMPITNANAFTNMNANCNIYVPDSLVDEYKSATNWDTFADNIKPISEYSE